MNWKLLENLAELNRLDKLSPIGKDNYETLLHQTEFESEHPEWYESECYCSLCMGYAKS